MYLRVKDLQRTFTIQQRTDSQTARGRVGSTYNGATTLEGVLVDATPFEQEKFKQSGHPITHTIKQTGPKKAEEGDRLVHDGRFFYIQTVENPADLGIRTLYRVQERKDGGGN